MLLRHAGHDPASSNVSTYAESRLHRERWIPASAGMTIFEGIGGLLLATFKRYIDRFKGICQPGWDKRTACLGTRDSLA